VSRPVRWRRESRLALGLLLGVGLLLCAALTGAQGAKPPRQQAADDLRRQQSGLAARSQTALLGLYALDSRLARAHGELERLRRRVEALRREQQLVLRQVAIVEGNLQASQRLLGDRLRALYEEGQPDAIAILLGAKSLDDAVSRLDELERSAHVGVRAASDARNGREQLTRLAAALAIRVKEVESLEAKADRTATALASARGQRVAYLASLTRQRRLNARQIAALDSRSRAVVARAELIQAQTVPAAATVVFGPRTLTVTATGYSLAGRTATGLPVGPGIVAVDPSVIPLGTRLTIPGYGEGVAADKGSAVVGNTIDLWFPTLADALAWGRRTVTITLH
jgi:3D (Asp-Asp-Asp) domain-containing protein/septal ring factor EnvC (AmiA/AmiB activator)